MEKLPVPCFDSFQFESPHTSFLLEEKLIKKQESKDLSILDNFQGLQAWQRSQRYKY